MPRPRADASATQMILQANDDIVQGLAAAKMALELGETEMAQQAVEVTLITAKSIVTDLIDLDPQHDLHLTRSHSSLIRR